MVANNNTHKRARDTAAVAPPPASKKHKPSTAPDSNWKQLQAQLQQKKQKDRPRKKSSNPAATHTSTTVRVHKDVPLTRVLAIDCEMVGVGPKGDDSRLARYARTSACYKLCTTLFLTRAHKKNDRVALINARSDVILDTFVQVEERVTDFRTKWSGVRAGDLKGAPPLAAVQSAVARLINGRILVGHAIQNDLDALQLTHPAKDLRDTSKVAALRRVLPNGRSVARSLKHLAAEEVGLDIQSGEHSPVEDARAALYLYHKHKQKSVW